MKKVIIVAVIAAVAILVGYAIKSYFDNRIYNDPAFAHGNGRLEATDVNITTKFSERIASVAVQEGDLVTKGQVLAEMHTDVLRAELAQAKAKLGQAYAAKISAAAKIDQRKSELETAEAELNSKQSAMDANEKRYERAKILRKSNDISPQQFENDETLFLTSRAEAAAARAGVKTAHVNIKAAEAEEIGAEANIRAAEAETFRPESLPCGAVDFARRHVQFVQNVIPAGRLHGAGAVEEIAFGLERGEHARTFLQRRSAEVSPAPTA